MRIPLEDQIECVQRELRMRSKMYPAWVNAGKMKKETAALELDRMLAVEETLWHLLEERKAKVQP